MIKKRSKHCNDNNCILCGIKFSKHIKCKKCKILLHKKNRNYNCERCQIQHTLEAIGDNRYCEDCFNKL